MASCVDVMSDELTAFLQIDCPVITIHFMIEKSEGVGISSSWNIYGEWPSTAIEEVEFYCEAYWFLWYKSYLNSDHLSCYSQIASSEVCYSQIDIWKLLGDCMFEVDVLVSSIVDLENSWADLSTTNSWKDEVGLVEVESGVASFSLNWYFHVAAGDVDFGLVNEEFKLPWVLSWNLSWEIDLDLTFLVAI